MMSHKPSISLEFEAQKMFLFSKIGVPGSGAIRYAAAMFFYNHDKISAEMLEIYRRCCKFDKEDPIDLAQFEGIKDIPNFILEL
jgi:hypothetical protein|tara:strand:- start:434 stop:685 length:252 start_codon:yes stop_codon:yes gene_type:complete